jgi:predicted MFS family arabinose efflux permease
MYSHRVKAGAYVLEGVNAFATTLYLTYLFFHMRDRFGFGNLENLSLSAVNGFVYTFAAWFGGRFAQRRGYFFALRLGFLVMATALLIATQVGSVAGHFATMIFWTLGICFTWPTLEAIVSEGEPPVRLPRLIGIYNLVWACASGIAYFVGGAFLEQLGRSSIFFIPLALHGVQLVLLSWLERQSVANPVVVSSQAEEVKRVQPENERRRSPVAPERFLKMAWLANPFAYITISALLPVIPRLAERLHLSPKLAGFFCSVWFFARAGSFLALWQWTGWHYRFRWLGGAFVAMGVSFALILLAGNLWVLLVAQVVFGLAVGLIYYSSLFYSMDLAERKGEHGGFHEAAIGIGICVGPALGAAALYFTPSHPNASTWAVCGLVLVGFVILMVLRWRRESHTA